MLKQTNKKHVLLFDERFVDLIKSGEKKQTLRKSRERKIRVGDTLDLRCWEGVPFKSKQQHLLTKTATKVYQVAVYTRSENIYNTSSAFATVINNYEFAVKEGFRDHELSNGAILTAEKQFFDYFIEKKDPGKTAFILYCVEWE
jgi:ASC-1-like (ASCH) protein